MRALRIHLPPDRSRIHLGPCPGGKFYALEGAHDLPLLGKRVEYIDLDTFKGRIFLQNAERPERFPWREVTPEEIKAFGFHTIEEWYPSPDNWGSIPVKVVYPFMPELYLVKEVSDEN